jgi:protein-L-isoaspartate(D-aspartate) O-methyltransferase
MVARQIAARGIRDASVLEAMREVPRETFVPAHLAELAFEDGPLPIGSGQTISQPYIVALMVEAAEIGPDDRVLEIGAGSGYAAAVMGHVGREVLAVERHHELAEEAAQRIEQLGYANVHIIEGDGTKGLPQDAPFDAIVLSASGSHVPDVLLHQLKRGGRLVMPVGGPYEIQHLVKVTRVAEEEFEREELCAVRFVPLVGVNA